MYLEQPLRLTLVEIAHLLQIAQDRLDLSVPKTGSGMTNEQETLAVFTPLLQSRFPGEWIYATVISLNPSAQLVAHVDAPFPQPGVRYHLPLQLNPGCWCYHDGVWQQLELGKVYAMDLTCVHGAVNWGDNVRLHLIMDVLNA